MGLLDLCAVKFRIGQRLENNRAAYNLVRTKMSFGVDEESEPEVANLALSKLKSKKLDGSQPYSEDEDQKKLPKKMPGVPGGRRKVNWDHVLNEIPALSYGMQEESKFRLAEAAHLCRKARKEMMKKENQSKGLREYRKLLSTQIGIEVTRSVRMMVTQTARTSVTEFLDAPDSDSQIAPSLVQTVKLIAEEAQITSDTPFNMSIDQLDKTKQGCLREIHKVLSKWNKPQIKGFLKSPLFESADPIIEDKSGQNWIYQPSSQSVASTNMSSSGNAPQQPIQAPQLNPAPSIVVNLNNSLSVNLSKESRKEDWKERELNRLLKCENSDEYTAFYLNRSNLQESYKKIFKTSIDTFNTFPKSLDEVPIAPLPNLNEDEMWENKTFFGSHAESTLAETGLAPFFDQVSQIVKEFPELVSTGNTSALQVTNHHEMVFKALSKGMMVVYEHFPTAERGESYSGLETCVKILNPSRADHFLDDTSSSSSYQYMLQMAPDILPMVASMHPLLHYTLHRLETRFGKRWFWIESLLKSNPLFKPYKLSGRTIGRLSIFFHMLAGERVLLNHRQNIPGERIANMEFFPADSSLKKRLIPGRKPKNLNRKKEETDFSEFVKKLQKEQLKLPWNLNPEPPTAELYYNKAVQYLHEKNETNANFKRFKPSRGRQTLPSGIAGLHTAGSSTSAKGEPRLERFNDRSPSEVLPPVEERGDKARQPIQNYIKHLKRRSLV